ncbi:pyrimidine 5'-nucleotidase [Pilobolus umbonatus]|nr:pyrimidine 5'-nucleotidase [Pilobolus umbonatus]
MPNRPVFFFDCDNCLYSKKLNVNQLMKEKIDQYFIDHVGIPEDEAPILHSYYYHEYGLSLRGLTKHHDVDPLHYDKHVDQALPLDGLIERDDELRYVLHGLNAKKWLFTNAYKPHAVRCLNLLGIEQEFEGITYTNYLKPEFNCKPEIESYIRAMEDAEVTDPSLCYFVDDSADNIDAAQQLGWTTVHLADDASTSDHGDYQIDDIHDLPKVLPELWELLPRVQRRIKRQSMGIMTAC